MDYLALERKVNDFYYNEVIKSAEKVNEICYKELNEYATLHPDEFGIKLKLVQYKTIAKNIVPMIIEDIPYYYETGFLHPFSNGAFYRSLDHANGWTFNRNLKVYEVDDEREVQRKAISTFVTMPARYLDMQHYKIPHKKIFEKGLKGVYEEALESLKTAKTDSERDFLEVASQGVLVLRDIMLKFYEVAKQKYENASDNDSQKPIYKKIMDASIRVPWEKPQSVYEGLATLAFMRTVLGSLEGVGFNSFGRVDVLLAPLYENDKKRGVSDEEIYDDIIKFLLIWEAHVDKSVIMEGVMDYEYENSLNLGGVDENGGEVFNPITKMMLLACDELGNTIPKIKCRYSSKSSNEYLKMISDPLLKSRSTILYCNDDVIIPALKAQGFDEKQIYDYTVSGCWDVSLDDYYKAQCGQFLNALKVLSWSMKIDNKEFIKNAKIDFKTIENAQNFEEVYSAVISNMLAVMRKKAELESVGIINGAQINPLPIYSALMYGPLEKKRDYTQGGGTYNWESVYIGALADTIDSLLSIKELCFDKKIISLPQLISECEQNFPNEAIRQLCLNVSHYGDGKEQSSKMFARFCKDIYDGSRDFPTSYGGDWKIGSYLYTEVVNWGIGLKATPNGRKLGDLVSQGFTPSRLNRIDAVTTVFDSLRYFDSTDFSGGTVINVVLPPKNVNSDILVDFLRASASTGASTLQINCVSKEELIAAQKEPEKYSHIIVRVYGFSARFVSLGKKYQDEFISRNFHTV